MLASWATSFIAFKYQKGTVVAMFTQMVAFGFGALGYAFMGFVAAPPYAITILSIAAFFNVIVMFALVVLIISMIFTERREKKRKRYQQ